MFRKKSVWNHTSSESCRIWQKWRSAVAENAGLSQSEVQIHICTVHKYPEAWVGSVASRICITCENISQEHHRTGKMAAEQLWKNLKVYLAVLLPSLVVSWVKDVLPWVSIDLRQNMHTKTMVCIPKHKELLNFPPNNSSQNPKLRRGETGTGMRQATWEPGPAWSKKMDSFFSGFFMPMPIALASIYLSIYLSFYPSNYLCAFYLAIPLNSKYQIQKPFFLVAAPRSNHHLQRGRIKRS